MTLIDAFKLQVPSEYPNIRLIQKSIYKMASQDGDNALSAARCAQIFSQSELFSLFLDKYPKVDFTNTEDLSMYTPAGDIALRANQLVNQIRIAIGEGKDFLSLEVIRVLEDFFTKESPMTLLNISLLLILAANTQE